MKRKTKLLVIGLYLLLPFSLFSCKKEEASDKIRAEFYLEGGSCQNNTEKITYLYNLGEREETYIADPNVLKKNDISRDGYTLKGWYQTKTIVGADVTYSNPWDFNQDKMTKDGVKLYAYWVRDVVYSYELYYKDGDTDVLLGSYAVEQGEHFDDYLNYANKRTGYTSLGYYDETGEEWDAVATAAISLFTWSLTLISARETLFSVLICFTRPFSNTTSSVLQPSIPAAIPQSCVFSFAQAISTALPVI
mgnify:CR=1 FL=1